MKVIRAQLHQTIDLKGVVSKKTLNVQDMKGAEFTFNGLVLKIKFKGAEFGIPAANVAAVVYSDETNS